MLLTGRGCRHDPILSRKQKYRETSHAIWPGRLETSPHSGPRRLAASRADSTDPGDRHDDPRHTRPAAAASGDQTQTAAELQEIWDADPRWDGIERTYTADDVIALRGIGPRGTDARPARRREPLEPAAHRGLRPRARRLTGSQAVQQVRAGLKAIYLSGWQVAADAQPRRADLPGPEPVPGELGAGGRPPDQQRPAARRPDRARRGRAHASDWLAPIVADAEAGFGGPLNAFELMQSMIAAGRRRRALGGPARDREEVRPPGRQGARPDAAAHPHAERRPARRRRRRRADAHHRPHRRPRRRPAHQRRRRARPAVPHRRAHRRGLLPGAHRPRAGHRPRPRPTRRTPTCSGWRPASPTSTWPARSPSGDPRASSPASCWPTTARRRSTGSAHLDDDADRDVPARARRRWATSSSSSPWPASTP